MNQSFLQRISCLGCLLLLSFAVHAQRVTISGYVTDKSTQESLIGANVTNLSTSQSTVTNNSGYYSITLPVGKVSLRVYSPGYSPVENSFELKKDTVLNISLSSITARVLNSAVVTARPYSELNTDAVGHHKLSMADLKRMPTFMGETDLIKYAQLLPGVAKGYEGFSGMVVRGGNMDENLFLVDGNSLYNTNHLFGLFSTFNSDAIKSADLYKGSFPARYGGRLSSVMDVHTNEGNMEKYHGTFSIGLISSRFSLEGPIVKGKTSFHASLRRTYLDLLAKPIIWLVNKNENSDVGFGYYFYDANVKVNHKFNDRHRLYFQLYSGYDVLNTSSNDQYSSGNYDYFKFGLKWGNLLTSVGWDYVVNPQLFAHTTAYFTHYSSKVKDHNKEKTGKEISEYRYQLTSGINDIGVRTDWDYRPAANHLIRFGGNYTFHTFHPNRENSSTSGNYIVDSGFPKINREDATIRSNEIALYLEDEMKLLPWLTVNLGARSTLIHVEKKNHFTFEPRFSLRTALGEQWSLKASYSKMTQAVHLLQGSVMTLPTDLWVPATGDLRPMVAQQASLGAYWSNNGYELTAEAYYKWMNNLIAYKDGESIIFSDESWRDRVTTGKGRSYGVELMFKKTHKKFTGWISYTLSWTNRIYPNGEVNNGKRFPDRFDNRHKLNVVGIWKVSPRVDLSATWSLSSGNRVTLPQEYYTDIFGNEREYLQERNNFSMPLYHRLDFSMNWYKFKKKGRMGIWTFGLYNVYMHHNTFMIIDSEDDHGRRTLKSISLFPILPSISYTFKF